MAWSKYRLATGGRDRGVCLRDVRASEPYFKRLSGHREEICGLKWSFDDQHLASGGNDNKVRLPAGAGQPANQATVLAAGLCSYPHTLCTLCS